jgi:hypothetical protein
MATAVPHVRNGKLTSYLLEKLRRGHKKPCKNVEINEAGFVRKGAEGYGNGHWRILDFRFAVGSNPSTFRSVGISNPNSIKNLKSKI